MILFILAAPESTIQFTQIFFLNAFCEGMISMQFKDASFYYQGLAERLAEKLRDGAYYDYE